MNEKLNLKAEWQQLAIQNSNGQMPPNPPNCGLASEPPRRESLTQKFNRAADPSRQVEMLRSKMSQLKPTLELGMRGSVARAYNPGRDRSIAKQIAFLEQSMQKSQQLAVKRTPIELGKSNQLKTRFNQASGMEM